MLRSHCRAIRWERHGWSWDFFEIKAWIRSDASRFAALGYDIITIGQFLVTRSGLVQMRSHTLGQDCPDWVHGWGVHLIRLYHDCGSRFGTMWHAHIRANAFIPKRRDLLWQDTIMVQRFFHNFLQSDHLNPIPLIMTGVQGDSATFAVLFMLISSPEKKNARSSQSSYKPSHKEPGELQSGSFRWHPQ